jgi:hypothetical protein
MKWKGMETKYEKYVQHLYSSLKVLGCKFKADKVGVICSMEINPKKLISFW